MLRRHVERYEIPGIAGLPEQPASSRQSAMDARRHKSRLERWKKKMAPVSRYKVVCLCCGAIGPYHQGVPPYKEICPRCRAAMSMLRR